MKTVKPTKLILASLFIFTFLLAFNVQFTPRETVNVNSNEPISLQKSNSTESIQKPDTDSVYTSRLKFNTTGITDWSDPLHYAGYNLLVNDFRFLDYQLTNDSYVFWNVSLFQGFYFSVTAYYTFDTNTSINNDLDMDVLYPNGSTWLVGESRTDNEKLGPVLIPEDGDYIIVVYHYNPGLYTGVPVVQTQIDSIQVSMVDLPTLQDNDINFESNYYNTSNYADVTSAPGTGGSKVYVYKLRTNTKIQLNFTYWSISNNVTLTIDDSITSGLLSTILNGSYTYFTLTADSYIITVATAGINIPFTLDITTTPLEDMLSKTYEVFTGFHKFLWESNTFNPNDRFNGYTSAVFGSTQFASHLENYRVYLYASQSIFVSINWGVNLRDVADSVFRIFNYDDAVSGTYTPISATNDINTETSFLSFNVGTSGWYILQAGNRILDDVNGWNTYTMDIVINDKYDVGTQNDDKDSATGLGQTDFRIGMTANQSSSDFYRVTALSGSRLTVDIEFNYVRGVLNIYVFNSSLEIVGSSFFEQQYQQHIEVLVFSDDIFYIMVNTSVQYDNFYDLYVDVGPIDDEYESNDVQSEAKQISGAGSYNLFLAKGNRDYFFLSLFRFDEATVKVNFNGSFANINLYIRDSNGFIIGTSLSATSDSEEVLFSASSTDIYIIQIVGVTSSFVNPGLDYELVVSILENDDNLEPNDGSGSPRALQDGFFDDLKIRSGDEDWYRIYLKQGENLTVTADFDQEKGDLDLILYDLSVTTVLASSQTFSGHEELFFDVNANREVLLRTVLFDGLSLMYDMNVTIPEIDDAYGWEDNDNFDQAVSVETSSFNNIEARGGDWDFYKIYVPKDYAVVGEITFDLIFDFELFMYTAQQAEINRSDSEINTERVGPIGVGEATDLYIVVHMKSYGITNYTLSVLLDLESILIPAPNIPTAPLPTLSLGFPTFTAPGGGIQFDLGGGIVLMGMGAGLGVGGTFGGKALIKSGYVKKKLFKKP